MTRSKAPKMQRSRGQIATAYAPHSLFTFEGGRGACIARPSESNRTVELPQIAISMIHEQIEEYFRAWFDRASRGNNLRHPVPPKLAVDVRVLSDGVVNVRIGELTFQVPDVSEYLPFPLAFVCGRCDLHRECRSVERLEQDAARFRQACPRGAAQCAEDWEQIDVVLTHWSGEIEAVSPAYRHWVSARNEFIDLRSCSSCNNDHFYLRRPPGPLAGWHFECTQCHFVRQLLQRDGPTLTELGPLLDQNLAIFGEINMEPISYRASAAYYVHGDRLLVFQDDRYLSLLSDTRIPQLEAFLSSRYGYPAATLDDVERERLLREAGRGKDWDNFQGLRQLLQIVENDPRVSASMIASQRATIVALETDWNETIFAGRGQAAVGIAAACRGRGDYVRRFDPVRMAVEHATLAEEKLHGGQTADGKNVSVDLTLLDPFLRPDDFSDAELEAQSRASRHRLGLLGIEEMRLIRNIEICEYSFGYTRTSSSPVVKRDKAGDAEMPVRLRLFDKVAVADSARHPILCLKQANEGFYVKLDERHVRTWLAANGVALPPGPDSVKLGGLLIEEFEQLERDPATRYSRFLDEYRREDALGRNAFSLVYTLLHTMAHHLIATSSEMSGLDLGSFGEQLFVPDLAFIVYRRGMTMDLGNLSSMWRDRGDAQVGNQVLEHMINPSSMRCGSESVCNRRGGACPDCILIPESACLTRNELLSRSVLVGRGAPRWDASPAPMTGYFEIVAGAERSSAASRTE